MSEQRLSVKKIWHHVNVLMYDIPKLLEEDRDYLADWVVSDLQDLQKRLSDWADTAVVHTRGYD